MFCLILIIIFIVYVSGLVPNENCVLNAKLTICSKYYPEAMAECVKKMKPTYNHNETVIFKGKSYTVSTETKNGLILKKHPTPSSSPEEILSWINGIEAEEKRGFKIIMADGRYYTTPEKYKLTDNEVDYYWDEVLADIKSEFAF
jgi:hypothetical protein